MLTQLTCMQVVGRSTTHRKQPCLIDAYGRKSSGPFNGLRAGPPPTVPNRCSNPCTHGVKRSNGAGDRHYTPLAFAATRRRRTACPRKHQKRSRAHRRLGPSKQNNGVSRQHTTMACCENRSPIAQKPPAANAFGPSIPYSAGKRARRARATALARPWAICTTDVFFP